MIFVDHSLHIAQSELDIIEYANCVSRMVQIAFAVQPRFAVKADRTTSLKESRSIGTDSSKLLASHATCCDGDFL
jgi:hypothetical protein